MDEEYDVIVLGTGLKECVLSGLLSVDGLKNYRPLFTRVLHIDRNDCYGGESTSLNLNQLWKRFRGDSQPPENLGLSKEYNVDMIPKFMMANGALVRVLIHTNVTKYLNFKAVDGSFVFNQGKIHKVPATDVEAPKSQLMGLFEKQRARKFFIYVQDYEENDPKSHEGLDLNKVAAREAFARLSAVYGGTYMLNKPECKIVFDENGKAFGVTSEGETAKCKKIVCDTSYLPDKVRKVGRVARAICIMSHPIPDTNDSHSVQVILPQKQLGPPKGKYIAFVSTEAETDNPETELKPGIDLLGPVEEAFFDIYDRYEPIDKNNGENCFISYCRYTLELVHSSYDATSHFESTAEDVIDMYSQITGKAFQMHPHFTENNGGRSRKEFQKQSSPPTSPLAVIQATKNSSSLLGSNHDN
ncbi:hypothetical protein ACLOJK_003072 [Asimina triloba]